MDTDLFLRYLRDHTLEEGRTYIQEHLADLSDSKATGDLLADEALRVLYTPFLSLKIAELLIFYGELTGHRLSYALGLKAKGDVLMMIGHYQAAIEILDRAGEEFLSIGDEGNWARSRISWVYSSAELGHIEEALRAAEQARTIFLRLEEYYWACVIDNNTAMVLDNIGRYQEALTLYRDMLLIYPTIQDQDDSFIKRSIAIAQVNQARLLAWLGKFEEAYMLQSEAQESFNSLGEPDLAIEVEINLAGLDFVQGYYGSALRRYYQAREMLLQSETNNELLLAELKLSMANCLVKLSRLQEAFQLSEEAVKIYRVSGLSLSTADALRDYAMILAACSRAKDASNALEEAWKLLNNGGFIPFALLTRLQQAELLVEMNAFNDAYVIAEFVKTYCETRGLVARVVRANLIMSEALVEKAHKAEINKDKHQQALELQEALSLCKQTALLARRHNLQEEIYKNHHLLGRIFRLQGNFVKAIKHFGASIVQIERILHDLVFDLSPSFLHRAWAVYADMIALCLERSEVEKAFAYLEQARSMALRQHLQTSKEMQEEFASASTLRTQYQLKDWQDKHRFYSVLLSEAETEVSSTIDKEIIQSELLRCEEKLNELLERLYLSKYESSLGSHIHSPKKRSSTQMPSSKTLRMELGQIRQHLTSDHLLLEYYLHKGKLVIFAITSEQVITYEHPAGETELEYLLPLFHAHLQPGGWPDPSQPPQQIVRRLLHKLYKLLIAPVGELLPPPSGYLTIVPYGPLHKLPFHALFDGSRFLIEDFQVSYLPASSLLLHLQSDWRRSGVTTSNLAETAKAPLVFGFSGKGQLARVRDEASTIAEMLGGHCYLEDEATIARLIEEAPGSPLIHLATHGHSRLDAPNFSYVRLADGQLNAIDAFNLDLRQCELVTLSGCETGLALSGGGDEQLGLGRAFLAAGAKSLIISLWPVEDHATNELMKCFYSNLLRGEDKTQALRTAQCSLLCQTGRTISHPYFWAAFRLVGEGGSLDWRRFGR
ncbi:MAG TPA: CHAT domain-containing protein [Ktedonobacteraceae bacterium]|jgi:CHAT domain-containing protein|nr:CHAT domain-containing protein [Ktedonobacteraceae bacterium]